MLRMNQNLVQTLDQTPLDQDTKQRYILYGAVVGAFVYAVTLTSAGNIMFRKDSEGEPRFRLFSSLKQGFIKPFFATAPTPEHTVKFFFRLDNPWFTIPMGALSGFFTTYL